MIWAGASHVKTYSFLDTLIPKCPDDEKVGTGPIFKVNTPFQRLISTLSSPENIILFFCVQAQQRIEVYLYFHKILV